MYEYKAELVRAVDGDTLDLKLDLGFGVSFTERFRLAGIDTPETYGVKKESKEYAEGMKAKNRVIELLDGKELIVQTVKDKKGKYGRYLAEIYIEDGPNPSKHLNLLLVQEGLAKKVKY